MGANQHAHRAGRGARCGDVGARFRVGGLARLLELLRRTAALRHRAGRDADLRPGLRRHLLGALINDPKILFLDEPTTGLDPHARRNFWQLIENIKAQNKTIILTTHYMDEAEQLCDDIVIMDQGKIIESGTPHQLLTKHFNDVYIYLPQSQVPSDLVKKNQWKNIAGRIEITTTNVEKTLIQLMTDKVSLDGLHVKSANLDDLFLHLTGHSLRSAK